MWNSRCAWLSGLLALVLATSTASAGDAVPVLIWGGNTNSSTVNPFLKTSQSDFEVIVTKKVGGTQRPILVFVRDNLCVEDFTQHREGLMHLKDDGSLVYLPAVESPMSVFETLLNYNQSMEEELETVLDGQIVITKATDLDAVYETYNMVKESSPNLIAALTGKSCSYSRTERVRRAIGKPTKDEKPDDPLPVIKTARFLIYWAEPPVLNVTEGISESKTEVLMSDYLDVTQEGEGTLASPLQLNFVFAVKNATTPFNATVSLEFNINSTSYYTTRAFYQDKERAYRLLTQSYFVFPYNVSYHCSSSVRFYQTVDAKKSLPGIDFVMSDFQLQIDPKHSNFSYAFDCVGFTSAPIWSGLFVTFILGLIMIWGLIMIMDIRTMDRFDDPKGKTITVTASE